MSADQGSNVFFIRDVFHHLRIQPTSELMWRAGMRMREVFKTIYDALPAKKLGPKTDGSGGTHCFAYYPMSLWDHAVKIVKSLHGEPARQFCFDYEFPEGGA